MAFSGVRKSLVQTDYNRRVDECSEAARLLLGASGRACSHPVLGDVEVAEYEKYRSCLPQLLARRADHFFSESRRVEEGRIAWQSGDVVSFGHLITQSGESSITSYECGSPPLVNLYHVLVETAGVFGARFSGAGFRGCCLALVDVTRAEAAREHVLRRYQQLHSEYANDASVWICRTSDGDSADRSPIARQFS